MRGADHRARQAARLRKGEAEDGHGFEGELSKDMLLTDPAEAADFVDQTQVDCLAIAIGTSHGAYKFTKPPTGEVLAINRIKDIHQKIPNTHLVMHGSSSVPKELLDIITKLHTRLLILESENSYNSLNISPPKISFENYIVLEN